MKNDACILLVDDNPDDRALVRHDLRREFPALRFLEVHSLEDLDGQLAQADLVITDYQLHGANGLQVLRKVKAAHPDTPVIMFTGTGSEEIAVEAMKSGLNDYVLKSTRPDGRLVAAVVAALRQRERQRELEEVETRFKVLFDTVPIGLFRCTPAGTMLDANGALLSILGFQNRADLMNASFASLHEKPEEFTRWREMLERHGSVAFIEAQFRGNNEHIRWVQIHARALRDPATGQITYEGSVEDITERKQAEQERERLITQLQDALARVKTLTGLLPICASCKKIREDNGTWSNIELYIQNHSEAQFTHGFCPDCVKRLYPFVDTP